MHPLVRDLWKRLVLVAADYPGGSEVVLRKGREAFLANRHLTDEVQIKAAVSRGRWYIRHELQGVIRLKKYREMNRRYGR